MTRVFDVPIHNAVLIRQLEQRKLLVKFVSKKRNSFNQNEVIGSGFAVFIIIFISTIVWEE